jgi:hypothetical protein
MKRPCAERPAHGRFGSLIMPYENIHRYKASPPRYGTAALLVSTFLFLAACTAPDGPNHHSVKRDFEWTIDTIRYEGATQLFFQRSSPPRGMGVPTQAPVATHPILEENSGASSMGSGVPSPSISERGARFQARYTESMVCTPRMALPGCG